MRELFIFLVVCGLHAPVVLSAQSSGKKTPAEKKSEEKAAKIAAQATKDLKAKEYEKALRGFEEAYALVPYEPGFLLNIGVCYQDLEQYNKAKDTYIKFLANAPSDHSLRPKVAEKLAEVDAILKELPKEPVVVPVVVVPEPQTVPVIGPTEAPPKKPQTKFFALAGVSSVGAAAFASVAFLSFTQGREEEQLVRDAAAAGDASATILHAKRMSDFYSRARTTALIADTLWVSTAVLGVVGLVARPKKEAKVSLSLSPNQISASLRF